MFQIGRQWTGGKIRGSLSSHRNLVTGLFHAERRRWFTRLQPLLARHTQPRLLSAAWAHLPGVERHHRGGGRVGLQPVSPLELQNAETKRTAKAGGSRRLQMSSKGQTRRAARGATEPGAITVRPRVAQPRWQSRLSRGFSVRKCCGVATASSPSLTRVARSDCWSAERVLPPRWSSSRSSPRTTNRGLTPALRPLCARWRLTVLQYSLEGALHPFYVYSYAFFRL